MIHIKKTQSNPEKQESKKHFGKIRFYIFTLIIVIIWWYNNFTLNIVDTELYYENISNEITVAVLSDLHAQKLGISNERIIQSIKDKNPDLICALGDMYSNDDKNNQEIVDIPIELLSELVSEGYQVYFVPGEHDNDEAYLEAMSQNGVHVIDYKSEILKVKDTQIQIFGIDNVYYSSTFDLTNEFDKPDENIFSILLAHVPNYSGFSQFGTDLTLCGDTHGGIFRLPFAGPLYFNGMFFPKYLSDSNIYDKGVFQYDGGNMFITSGIGNYPVPMRFFNRPELVFITLKHSQ